MCVSHQRAIKIASNSHNSSVNTNKTVQNCYLKTSNILLKVKRKLSVGWVLHISSYQVAIKQIIYNPSPSLIFGNILKNVAAHSNFPRFFIQHSVPDQLVPLHIRESKAQSNYKFTEYNIYFLYIHIGEYWIYSVYEYIYIYMNVFICNPIMVSCRKEHKHSDVSILFPT